MQLFNIVVVGALALGGCAYNVINLPVADASDNQLAVCVPAQVDVAR